MLLQQLSAAVQVLGCLAPVEAGDIGQVFHLLRRPVAVGAVNLPINMTGVDKENFVGPLGLLLALSKNQRVQGKVTV